MASTTPVVALVDGEATRSQSEEAYLRIRDRIVSLGAHLLKVGQKVRVELQSCFDEALALAGVPVDEPHSRSGSELRQHE